MFLTEAQSNTAITAWGIARSSQSSSGESQSLELDVLGSAQVTNRCCYAECEMVQHWKAAAPSVMVHRHVQFIHQDIGSREDQILVSQEHWWRFVKFLCDTQSVWGSLLVCTRHHTFAQYLMTSNLYVYVYTVYIYIFICVCVYSTVCIYIYIYITYCTNILTCVKSLYKSRVNTAHQHITEPKRHGKTWTKLQHTRCPVRKWPLSGCWYPGSLRPSRHGWPKSQLGAPRVSHDPVSASEKIELGPT